MVFFEKKNQKTFAHKARDSDQKFSASFFQKRSPFLLPILLSAISINFASAASAQGCPARPPPSAVVRNPFDLVAANGMLKAALTIRSLEMAELPLKVCYAYESTSGTVEAPTLRLAPGDVLDLAVINRLTYVPPTPRGPTSSPAPHDPCAGGAIAATSTNLAFDGLAISPDCHRGEAISTTIENTDPPFDYRFQIPKDNPPGLYLYHPHQMGSASLQVESGASGVLIVAGMERAKPEVTGLPERILVFRQQFDEPDSMDDASWISVNFQPVGYRHLPPPVIRMKPGAREFWRLANATSGAFLALQVVYEKDPQSLTLVALDGVPTDASENVRTVELPPGGRAEFVVTGPASGQEARLMQAAFETGPIGSETPAQQLATIEAAPDAEIPPPITPGAAEPAWTPSATRALAERQSAAQRKLYFGEAPNGTNGPTKFFLTVEGQKPQPFDPSAPPAIVTHVGAVEDWIVANHSGELHAFHAQGLHFLLLEVNGKRLPSTETRDAVTVPAWEGEGAYPTVKLRMDFSSPRAAGAHIIECHVLRHAEAGMMAKVQVDPR
jgi:FtsP/CotA-like multicopper oxidase with cupredoxin domain